MWHGVPGTRPVQVVLIRDKATAGYDPALATTDLAASPAAAIERYAARWPIEVAIEDARQIFGAGEARNRLAAAVHRTLPFTLACQTIAMLWYATAGHHPGDVDDHRVGCQKSAWPVSCSDAPGPAVGHDDQLCPSVCSI